MNIDEIYVIDDDKELNTRMFNEWKKWLREIEEKSSSRTAAMFSLQKALNDFIDSKKSIRRDDKLEWYRRNVAYAAMEVGETMEELKIKHWVKDKEINRKVLLEEFVDIWHFIMSAGIDSGLAEHSMKNITKIVEGKWYEPCNLDDIECKLEIVERLLMMVECLRMGNGCYTAAITLFVEALGLAGYNFDEFYKAYLVKNFKNFARQESPRFRGGKYY